MELDTELKLSINLEETPSGEDRLVIRVEGEACELRLTPHQARRVATELILTVNRAEVRSNLRKSQNYTRNAGVRDNGRMREVFAK